MFYLKQIRYSDIWSNFDVLYIVDEYTSVFLQVSPVTVLEYK